MRRGAFTIPTSVRKATEDFKREADPLRTFIGERIKADPHSHTPRTDIYVAYSTWSAINGYHQMSANRFYESLMAALTDSGITVRVARRDGYPGLNGIALN